MKPLRLAARMLRYRVAALLFPFFALGPALHGAAVFRWQYVAALIALCASYVVATCVNDVFDEAIDRVNNPGRKDRPLVTGEATRRQLLQVTGAAAAAALAAGSAIGPFGALLVALSLVLDVIYSAPPLRLCARAEIAPVALALAYTAIPYGLGLAAGGFAPAAADARLLVAFAALFTGRMLLKDFRDRRGDAAHGKRTFLLAHGKRATLTATLATVVIGGALLLSALPAAPVLTLVVTTYLGGVLLQLARLWRTSDEGEEQAAIAAGARMGSAVVLTLLGALLLIHAGASATDQSAFALAMAAAFWFAFAAIERRRLHVIAVLLR